MSEDNYFISLKEFKKMVKDLGYKVKTYVYTFRHLEVLNKDNKFICGSGANVYTEDTIKKHKNVFDLLNKYRNRVFDYDYQKPLKVLF